MFKRCESVRRNSVLDGAIFGLMILLASILIIPISAMGVEPRASIQIGKTHSSNFSSSETISIYLHYDNQPDDPLVIAGYDLLLKYNQADLVFESAEPGEIITNCGWEYFTYQADTLGYLRLVAVAEINDGDNHPDCLANTTGELAKISFTTPSFEGGYECTFLPVSFWWADCGDNAVSGPSGETLFVSNEVFDIGWSTITDDQPLPTRFGAPEVCVVNPGGSHVPVRAVDFYNGGIDMVCIDSIDARGDINLNEIANEVADWVLYTNYFYYGAGVFTVNFAMQAQASDVNSDGIQLTLWDLVYLYRIIAGDANPFPSPAKAAYGDTVYLVQDMDVNTVTVNYSDSLSALMLYFDGEVEITTILPNHSIGYEYDGSQTKAMVFPLGFGGSENPTLPTIADGQVFEYTGSANLVGALAAYNGLSALQASVSGSGTSACCANRGDVNNDGSDPDIADLVALVNYLFAYGEGYSIPCPEQGNIDGLFGSGGPIDISDMVFLVDYMFRMGTQIPSCSTR